jgi:hypothetical protein
MSAEKGSSDSDNADSQNTSSGVAVYINHAHLHADGDICADVTVMGTDVPLETVAGAVASAVENVFADATGKGKGPAKVNSAAYLRGYDEINWGKKGSSELN